MNDPRLGEFTEKGMVGPVADVTGQPYERGVGSIAHVGSQHFVVLPIGYQDDGTLERLRLQAMVKPGARPSKKETAVNDDE